MQSEQLSNVSEKANVGKKGETGEGVTYSVEEWIVQFSRLFKTHVGFDTDPYLDLHELGMELYSEAMEDTVTTESSQNLFDIAGSKFQEMSALALFNMGNVHMNKARKGVVVSEDTTKESIAEQVRIGYGFAQQEYEKPGTIYEESIYEGTIHKAELLNLGLEGVIKDVSGDEVAGLSFKIDEIVQAWNEMFDTKRW